MRVAFLITCCLFWAVSVSALTIDQDTLWKGEKVFSETVRVSTGASLTIVPGSTVRFDQGGLEVSGRLSADSVTFEGSDWNGIVLKGCDGTTRLANSTVSGAKTGVKLQGGSPLLEAVLFTGNAVGVEVRGKAIGRITRCRFLDNRKVGLFLKDESRTEITKCDFEGNQRYGAYIYRALPGQFRDNLFQDNPTALKIAYFGSDPLVENNRFQKNETAIEVDRAARPTLRGNRIHDNRTGIILARRADARIVGNRLERNSTAIRISLSSYPRVEANDFASNGLAIELDSQSSAWERDHGASARARETSTRSAFAGQGMKDVREKDRQAEALDGTIRADGNWWGTEETRELEQLGQNGNPSFIHDGRDRALYRSDEGEYAMDRVIYSPWSKTSLLEASP